MTDNKPYTAGYADLSHATVAREIGVCRARPFVTDRGDPVYMLAVKGECTCGEYHREAVVMLSTTTAAAVIAQLRTRLFESGMATKELDDLIAAEAAYIEPEDDDSGQLVPGCLDCGRARPECDCVQRHRAAQ